MDNIIINNLDESLKKRLEQRATARGHSLEEEIKLILQTTLNTEATQAQNLTAAIEQRFAHLEAFKLPEVKRDPMRPIPQFEVEE